MSQMCKVCDSLVPRRKGFIGGTPKSEKFRAIDMWSFREGKEEDPEDDNEPTLMCRYCAVGGPSSSPRRGVDSLWELELLLSNLHIGEIVDSAKKKKGNKKQTIVPMKSILKKPKQQFYERPDNEDFFNSLLTSAPTSRKRPANKQKVRFASQILDFFSPLLDGRSIKVGRRELPLHVVLTKKKETAYDSDSGMGSDIEITFGGAKKRIIKKN